MSPLNTGPDLVEVGDPVNNIFDLLFFLIVDNNVMFSQCSCYLTAQ